MCALLILPVLKIYTYDFRQVTPYRQANTLVWRDGSVFIFSIKRYKKNRHQHACVIVTILAIMFPLPAYGGRDSSAGTATRYQLDSPGNEYRWGARFSAPVQTGPGAHPASCTMDTGSFPGVKRPVRGTDPPPPSSVPRS